MQNKTGRKIYYKMDSYKGSTFIINAKLTRSDDDRRAGDGCCGNVANSAPTDPHVLCEENSLLLEVIIQSHHVVAHVHRWIGGAVIRRV